MKKANFLIEIGCAEIPAGVLTKITKHFEEQVVEQLLELDVEVKSTQSFSTPRRIALHLTDIAMMTDEKTLRRYGPNIKYAYDKDGAPTKACLGFAKSVNSSVENLQVETTSKGDRLYFDEIIAQKPLENILPEIVTKSLTNLAGYKLMRWGSNDDQFIRPVYWILMLFNNKVVPMTLFGIESSDVTYGHRFHANQAIKVTDSNMYQEILSKNYVVADSKQRHSLIAKEISNIEKQDNCKCISDPALLDEVTRLVEFPVVLQGSFDKRFLSITKEILTLTMQTHQKYFPTFNNKNEVISHASKMFPINGKELKSKTKFYFS